MKLRIYKRSQSGFNFPLLKSCFIMNLTDFTIRAMEENGTMNYLHARYLALISAEGRKNGIKYFNPEVLLFSPDELDKPSFLISNDLVILYLLSFGFDNTLFALQAENSENHGFDNFLVEEVPQDIKLPTTETPIIDLLKWYQQYRDTHPQKHESKSKHRKSLKPPQKSSKSPQKSSHSPNIKETKKKTSSPELNNPHKKPVKDLQTIKQQHEAEEESYSPFNTILDHLL